MSLVYVILKGDQDCMGSKIGALKTAARRLGLPLEEYIAHIGANEKWCYRCEQWLSISNFTVEKARHDGRRAMCTICSRVKVRKNTKGRTSSFKGRTHTPQACAQMSHARLGNQNAKGFTYPLEHRQHLSKIKRATALRGERNPRWKGGITATHQAIRMSIEYSDWRRAVFTRDHFTCQRCGDNRGGNLHAHHIKSFADYPELRLVVSNGQTLCKQCHEEIHSKKNSETRKNTSSP